MLKAERERQRVTAVEMAAYLDVSEDMVRRYDSGRSDITLRQASKYAERLGKQLGDILPASQLKSGELLPILAAIQDFDQDERAEMIRKVAYDLAFMSSRLNDRAARRSSNVIEFPSQRTAPEPTPEFPVKPEDFIATGDGDYPLFLHGWEIEDLRGAAGDEPATTENPMGTILNMKEVREGRVRSIKVQGDSMKPTFEEGWLIAVDVGLRNPKDEDPVAVYRPNVNGGGIILGRWEKRGERIRLLKDNDTFGPVDLRKDDMLVGTIIDIIKKPIPPPPKRKR